jgi:methionyl-tRNA formyltransferase
MAKSQKPKAKIIFMGTPELAAHCLKGILEAGFEVAGVVTAPDRPAGRGRKLSQSPVKALALERDLPLLQPENLKDPEFIGQLKALRPTLQVVVAFRMLPEVVWSLPPLGTFNMHASLLPDYRGAAPINWVLINGEKKTGVTTFLLDHQIDTGNILMQKEVPIDQRETAGSLQEKIKAAGTSIVLETIRMLAAGEARPISQSKLIPAGARLHKAPKIYREDCRIDWSRTVEEVVNLVRGLNPQPGAFCEYDPGNGETLYIKLFEATPQPGPHPHKPGKLVTDNKTSLAFAAGDGFVQVDVLQMPGKKPMKTEELLRGFQF